LERDPLLTPQLLRHNKPERLAAQRMKRVSDPNLPLISGISCI
jgi:hypothetical protein